PALALARHALPATSRQKRRVDIPRTAMHTSSRDAAACGARAPGRRWHMEIPKDLVAASAAPLVLGILAEQDSYGYAIIKRVAELSDGELAWTEGLLYPLLHRLERQGHVVSEWGSSDTGRRRKYYRLTADGRAAL